MIDSIRPIVLTGGASIRFGADKLLAPIGPGECLIDRPIRALRTVFGPRISIVGQCDPRIIARADAQLPDDHPGAGPIGGILSALERTQADVFVLAGDLARISADSVLAIIRAAEARPGAWAILARTDRTEACIGLYRRPMATILRERRESGRHSLHDAAPPDRIELVPIPPPEAANINTKEELRRLGVEPGR